MLLTRSPGVVHAPWCPLVPNVCPGRLPIVSLSINTAEALRTRAELVSLIQAIRDASTAETETNALEWKRGLDLGAGAEQRFKVGKHILGFGNRTVSAASRCFGGCAYLLLGVEPGAVSGCPVWDAADIDKWIGRFVGQGAPRWSAQYVQADGAEVLVFTVEPVRAGDAMCTLQRTYEGFAAGRVFVRRGGLTEEADPTEIRALETRHRLTEPEVEIEVGLARVSRLTAVRLSGARRDQWHSEEAKRYVGALRAHQDRRRREPFHSSVLLSDSRSPSAYEAEISTYLEQAHVRWQALALQSAIQRGLGEVRVELRNPTRANWERVELELRVPGGVEVFLDDEDPFAVLDAPTAPKEFGDQNFLAARPVPLSRLPRDRPTVVSESEDRTVRFASVHLRPGAVVPLPAIHLLAKPDLAGEALAIPWRATSTSGVGWTQEVIEIPIAPEPDENLP